MYLRVARKRFCARERIFGATLAHASVNDGLRRATFARATRLRVSLAW
jgi:hypothetical protein